MKKKIRFNDKQGAPVKLLRGVILQSVVKSV
jgi:hypothetical protein